MKQHPKLFFFLFIWEITRVIFLFIVTSRLFNPPGFLSLSILLMVVFSTQIGVAGISMVSFLRPAQLPGAARILTLIKGLNLFPVLLILLYPRAAQLIPLLPAIHPLDPWAGIHGFSWFWAVFTQIGFIIVALVDLLFTAFLLSYKAITPEVQSEGGTDILPPHTEIEVKEE